MTLNWKIIIGCITVLLVWKLIRTDWVVSAPYWFGDPTETLPGGEHSIYNVPLPVSPLWMPPKPSDPGIDTTDWKWLFPGGGAYGITGEPHLKINWLYVGFKLAAGSIILLPIALLTGRIWSRRQTEATRHHAKPNETEQAEDGNADEAV